MKAKNKAVVLGANYYIGLSVIRCLGREGVRVAAVDYESENAYAFRSKYCSEKLIGPHYKEEPEAFLDFLIDYGKRQEAKPVLFPCADPYVEFIDRHFDQLKEHYLFPQTEKGLFTRAMNKDSLMEMAERFGVRVPETVRISGREERKEDEKENKSDKQIPPRRVGDEKAEDRKSEDEFARIGEKEPDSKVREKEPNRKIREKESDYIRETEERLGYPCIVKPTDSPAFVSVFRRKIFKVHNRHELIEAVSKAQQAGLEVFVQRIVPGFDDHMYTFDAHMDQNAEVTHWTTCQKFRQYPINFGASVYTTQRHVPELYEIGAKFFKDIGFKGFAEIEFKKDEKTGEFYLIEINVRTTNFNAMLEKVGLNMPYLTYLEMTGEPIGKKAVTEDTGVTFWYAFEDFFASMDYIRQRQLSPLKIMASLFRKKACAIWDADDMAPFFYHQKLLLKKAGRKIKKR